MFAVNLNVYNRSGVNFRISDPTIPCNMHCIHHGIIWHSTIILCTNVTHMTQTISPWDELCQQNNNIKRLFTDHICPYKKISDCKGIIIWLNKFTYLEKSMDKKYTRTDKCKGDIWELKPTHGSDHNIVGNSHFN